MQVASFSWLLTAVMTWTSYVPAGPPGPLGRRGSIAADFVTHANCSQLVKHYYSSCTLLAGHFVAAGAYYDSAYQPASFCSFGPSPGWAPNSTAGWPAACGRVLVGTVCTAACGINATGVDYTARCDASDKWTLLGGGCTSESLRRLIGGGALVPGPAWGREDFFGGKSLSGQDSELMLLAVCILRRHASLHTSCILYRIVYSESAPR